MYNINKKISENIKSGSIITKLIMVCSLMLFVSSIPCAVFSSEISEAVSYEKLDTRLRPWTGSWHLITNKVNSSKGNIDDEFLLTITPGKTENSLMMKGYKGEEPVVEEEIIVDGKVHSLADKECEGWYRYTWSDNGTRMLFNSESTCPGDPPRIISGMSLFDEKGNWLDIQLLKNGQEKTTNTRKYRNVSSEKVNLGQVNANRANYLKNVSGKDFTIEEIEELSNKIDSEIIEAALLETGNSFPLNSKRLAKIADTKISPRVLNLMVALSFPDKFNIHGNAVSLMHDPEYNQGFQYFETPYQYCSHNYMYFPWHWASSSCSPYGYTYLGWYVDYDRYYSLWSHPPEYYYNTGGGGSSSGSYNTSDGRLIGGQGYKRTDSGTTTRSARPRYAPSASVKGSSSSSSSSSYVPSSTSSGSSGSSSSGSSSGNVSISVQPSASPGGYRSGR